MFLSNLKVGLRLLIGFGSSLLLLIGVALVSWLSMSRTIDDTKELLTSKLMDERLASDWKSIVEVNVQRSLAAAKATEPVARKFFEDGIAASSKQGEADQDALARSLHDVEAKQLFATALKKRTEYLAARKKVLAVRDTGDLEKTQQIVDDEFVPAAKTYVEAVGSMIQRQKAVIDEIGNDIEVRSKKSRATVVWLTTASVALAIGLGWAVARSLLHQLGGEPTYAAQITDRIAAGDLTVEVYLHPKDQSSLLYSIAVMRERLVAIVQEVRSGTDLVTTASNEIADGYMDLSSRTEEQAGSLEETASSMEELTATVKQNGDRARHANDVAAAASDVARRGGGAVTQAVTMMNSIDESSRRIVEIISVIDSIAFQTNLLALNAAVEAARAGKHGRGFAVVATEVRNLAHHSAAAAKDIKVLISDSVEKIASGSVLVREAGSTINEVVTSVRQVSEILQGITTASREQEAGIEQINEAISEMDGVTQHNATLVEEAAAAAESLKTQSQRLAAAVGTFKFDRQAKVYSSTSGAVVAPASVAPRRFLNN